MLEIEDQFSTPREQDQMEAELKGLGKILWLILFSYMLDSKRRQVQHLLHFYTANSLGHMKEAE